MDLLHKKKEKKRNTNPKRGKERTHLENVDKEEDKQNAKSKSDIL